MDFSSKNGRTGRFKYMTSGYSATRVALHCEVHGKMQVDRAPADLLIPEHMARYAFRLCARHGHWRNLVDYCVHRYRARIVKLGRNSAHLAFKYQSEGLRLQRVSYLPYTKTRAELRMLSFAVRMSMCALVVLMLEWEQAAEGGKTKNPGVTMKFEVRWRVQGDSLTVFTLLRHKTGHPPHPA